MGQSKYSDHAEAALPRQGIRSLRDYGLLRSVDFVVLEPKTWAAMTQAQQTDLKAELSRFVHTIYYTRDDIPADALEVSPVTAKDKAEYERMKTLTWVSLESIENKRREIESGRHILAFRKGLEIRWELGDRGLFWVEC